MPAKTPADPGGEKASPFLPCWLLASHRDGSAPGIAEEGRDSEKPGTLRHDARFRAMKIRLYIAALVPLLSSVHAADVSSEDGKKEDASPQWKLTTGWYHFSNNANAGDFNLRYTWKQVGNFWIGYYLPDEHDSDQFRTGWDSQFPLGPVRILPSLQAASRGFLGGSFGVETGEDWFIGAGYGRTNLRPYVNLNFDPNDSYTINAGYRWTNGASASVLWVQDIRLNPDQKHLHLNYRTPLPNGRRLTLDVLLKTGLVEGKTIYKAGASVTCDWPRFFVRGAFDPNANFAPEDMWRFSVGMRF